jgi:hypothetical protein
MIFINQVEQGSIEFLPGSAGGRQTKPHGAERRAPALRVHDLLQAAIKGKRTIKPKREYFSESAGHVTGLVQFTETNPPPARARFYRAVPQ